MNLLRQGTLFVGLFIASMLLVVACGTGTGESSEDVTLNREQDHESSSSHADPWAGVKKAICVLESTEGNTAHGTVTFEARGDHVHVHGEFAGLSPNAEHAIHIHEFGDITAVDGAAAGGHYNPEGHQHGLPDQSMRHAGDFGNLKSDADGNATFDFEAMNITLASEKNPIIGRGMIVHAKADDGGQPTGNAGARIAQGVIGIAKSAE